MTDRCEVCESVRPHARFGGNYRVVQVPFDVRPVKLCVGHLKIARNSGVSSFAELRALYGKGRRSYVPRRRPSRDPRACDRRSAGRRAGEAGLGAH